MRTNPIPAVVLMAISLAGGCAANIQQIDTSAYRTISPRELKQESPTARTKPSGNRLTGKERFVVHLPAGTLLPVNVVADIPLARLEPGHNRIRVKREIYLLFDPKRGVKISPDRQRWADISDRRAIQELFGTRGRGSFSFGIGGSKEKGLFVNIVIRKPARR